MDSFQAISEPTRREIVELLVNNGEKAASEIYKEFDSSPPAISQHLKVLREVNLVKMQKRAQKHYYTINPEARDWLEKIMRLWAKRFDRLERLV